MSDRCVNCMCRGDMAACKQIECPIHESWYAQAQQAEIERLEKENRNLRELEGKPTSEAWLADIQKTQERLGYAGTILNDPPPDALRGEEKT